MNSKNNNNNNNNNMVIKSYCHKCGKKRRVSNDKKCQYFLDVHGNHYDSEGKGITTWNTESDKGIFTALIAGVPHSVIFPFKREKNDMSKADIHRIVNECISYPES